MFLALYLGCKTNQKSTPLGYLLHLLIQRHQGPFLCFLESSWPGDSTVVDVQTLLNMSLRSTYFDESFSWYKTKLLVLGLPSKVLDYQDFQISDFRLKEFFLCINQFISRVQNFISLNLKEFFLRVSIKNLKSPGENLGRQCCLGGFNSGVKGLICRFQIGDHRVKMVGNISQLWYVPDLFVYVILIYYCHF